MGAPVELLILALFPIVFLVCLVWATRGHTADATNEDLGVVAKDH